MNQRKRYITASVSGRRITSATLSVLPSSQRNKKWSVIQTRNLWRGSQISQYGHLMTLTTALESSLTTVPRLWPVVSAASERSAFFLFQIFSFVSLFPKGCTKEDLFLKASRHLYRDSDTFPSRTVKCSRSFSSFLLIIWDSRFFEQVMKVENKSKHFFKSMKYIVKSKTILRLKKPFSGSV